MAIQITTVLCNDNNCIRQLKNTFIITSNYIVMRMKYGSGFKNSGRDNNRLA